MKVYCKSCRYYGRAQRYDWCESPENMGDTYLQPNARFLNKPSELNAQNDCKMFLFKAKCSECKYYIPENFDFNSACVPWGCVHPSNVQTVVHKLFLGKETRSRERILLPEEKNKEGNCSAFEKMNVVIDNET